MGGQLAASSNTYCSTVTGDDQSRDPNQEHVKWWRKAGRDTCLRYLSHLSADQTKTSEEKKVIETTKRIIADLDFSSKLKDLLRQPSTAVSGENGEPAKVPQVDSFATWTFLSRSTKSSFELLEEKGLPIPFQTELCWKFKEERSAWEPQRWEMRFHDPDRHKPPKWRWDTVWRGSAEGVTQTTERFQVTKQGDLRPLKIRTLECWNTVDTPEGRRVASSRGRNENPEREPWTDYEFISLWYPLKKDDWKLFMSPQKAILELEIDPSSDMMKSHWRITDEHKAFFVDKRLFVSSDTADKTNSSLYLRNPSHEIWTPTTAEPEEQEREGCEWFEGLRPTTAEQEEQDQEGWEWV